MTSRRYIAATVLSLLLGGSAQAADDSLACDFGAGIPDGWETYDLDGNAPSKSAQAKGFEVGKAWISIIGEDGNRSVCSTSWYSPAGKSDDWLVTPAVSIDADYVLEWRSMATDPEYADGLSVYVSATGNAPSDFSDAAVFSVKHEAGSWQKHSVDLSAFKGRKIWLAFVNDSENCSCLLLDDVYVGKVHKAEVKLNILPYTAESLNYVYGEVSNVSAADLNGFTIEFNIDGQSISQHFSTTVKPGATVSFKCEEGFVITTANRKREYSVRLLVDNNVDYVRTGEIILIPHKSVVEEATGAWCAYCVGGRVAIKRLMEKYPDNFIGIAVQNSDKLTYSYYDEYLGSAFHINSYPTAILNRESSLSISDLYEAVDKSVVQPTSASILLDVDFDDASSVIRTSSKVYSAVDYPNPLAIAIVITEDNISMPDLLQHNAYSGTDVDMDGWEDLPANVPSEVKPFNHVARYISDFYGNADSVIDFAEMGHEYEYDFECALPENISDKKQTHITALLLDTKSRKVLNADQKPLIPGEGGIDPVVEKNILSVSYFDLAGRKLNPGQAEGFCIMQVKYADGSFESKTVIKY
ncbi:MAG: Omp28-related outer membrane protein [Muribaculaceae bacterium]|nr:Omp28-related outer membrane protein [Muribaculaceae bacterium]